MILLHYMRLINIFFFVLLSQVVFSQVKISTNPTGKHRQYINYANYAKGSFHKAKSVKKDSIEVIKLDTTLTKKEKRKKIRKFNSWWKEEKKRQKQNAASEVENHLGYELPDSITYPPKTPDDSLKWAMQVLASSGQYEEIVEVYEEFQLMDSTTMDSLGYQASQRSAKIAEGFIPSDVKSQLNESTKGGRLSKRKLHYL